MGTEKDSFLAGIRFSRRILKKSWKKLKDEEHLAILTFMGLCQTFLQQEMRGR